MLHATAIRDKSRIVFSGSLDAADDPEPDFNSDSNLHLHAQASQVAFDDIAPLLPESLHVSGTLNATIDADGPLHDPRGKGTIDLSNGVFYGEPLKRLSLEGVLASPVLTISSASLALDAGSVTASGTYNLRDKSLKIDAHSAAIDLSRVAWLHQQGVDATGQLTATISGSGTLEKPLLRRPGQRCRQT